MLRVLPLDDENLERTRGSAESGATSVTALLRSSGGALFVVLRELLDRNKRSVLAAMVTRRRDFAIEH